MESKSTFTGFVLDPSKCSQLSLEEKRELVREIAQFSNNASEMLTSFTRGELLEIICAEMGKERKYSGYTKHRMIEHLLKLISHNAIPAAQVRPEMGCKRKRVNELSDGSNHVPPESTNEKVSKTHCCQNAACRASLSPDDAFCKRCSCCICQKFDDNKDPSQWLTCESDSYDVNKSCGLSCHLECALKDERCIINSSSHANLDGSFHCIACGKINDLMRTWRKQLLVAKDTRRVDMLCLRISLARKILMGTEKYKDIQKTTETALEMLMNEVGPSCTNMARGIVNRLSCGPEVQKLCAAALEAFDSTAPEPQNDQIRNKELESIEHEKEETFATARVSSQVNSTNSSNTEPTSGEHEAWRPLDKVSKTKNEKIYSSTLSLASLSPSTPCQSHKTQEIIPGSSWKKGMQESDSEYSMRIVKWLEHDGHIDKDFEVKFLSWFSVKANKQERRVVSVFIDALIDDPACLGEQLCHTFTDVICCKQMPVSRHRFCAKLWH